MCLINRPPQDDYSATNLQTVGDVLYLNLFDEYIVDVNQVRTSLSVLNDSWSVVSTVLKSCFSCLFSLFIVM